MKILDLYQKLSDILQDELDEGFPDELKNEFWESLEKIAVAWTKLGLREKVIKQIEEEGFSVKWFKWGQSSGFPVLVIKVSPTPDSKVVWNLADKIQKLIDENLETTTACIVT